jgi:4'-phosphopantetheinyl transferase
MNGKRVYWLFQTKVDIPANDDWLSLREKVFLQKMKFPKRSEDWRLGRWTAKSLIYSYLKIIDGRYSQFTDMEVLTAEDGSPVVFEQKEPSSLKISISHRANAAFCVLNSGDIDIGCDLEVIEERSDAFVSDYFTFEEKLKVIMAADENKPLLANLIWSAKESVLKTVRQGLKSDTRNVLVDLDDLKITAGWDKMTAKLSTLDEAYHGWWLYKERYILTIFSSESTEAPIELPIA